MTLRPLVARATLLAIVTPALLAARPAETLADDQAAATRAPAAAPAQGDKLVVPFSDPGRPGTLRVGLTTGSIHVTAHQGKDVIIASRSNEADRPARAGGQGMRRIGDGAAGLTVEEERNEMKVWASNPNREVTLDIQVPTHTSLVLHATNNGDITVRGVDGDIEVNNTNGGVTLTGVSGAVVAHALNRDVVASLVSVSGKPMSFTSLNGDIDITLPASIKATLRLEPGRGEVYSDFDIEMLAPAVTQEGGQRQGGKYVVKTDQAMQGKINGGGPEITCKTFNGQIRIRKGA